MTGGVDEGVGLLELYVQVHICQKRLKATALHTFNTYNMIQKQIKTLIEAIGLVQQQLQPAAYSHRLLIKAHGFFCACSGHLLGCWDQLPMIISVGPSTPARQHWSETVHKTNAASFPN